MPSIRVQLMLNDLGDIPEYHQDDPTISAKATAYFDNGISEEPLAVQLAHFGKKRVARMLKGELLSWLGDLGTAPRIASITITD